MNSNTRIQDIIRDALQAGASDIHIQEDGYSYIRINGDLLPDGDLCTDMDIDAFMGDFASDEHGNPRRDFSFSLDGRRFRGNYYKAQKKRNLAIRALSERIPTMEELHLPKEMFDLRNVDNGLILVVGETGSGKSTTIASLIQQFNEGEAYNIITIEDPVEYIYSPSKSRIAQREVGTDVESFAAAVKDAMREDPDIIVLGEMRDRDTIQNAITLAETGHMVFATLHSRNVVEVMDRVVDVFPGDSKSQIRSQLANVLQAVVHQSLIKSDEYGRLPLLEILRVDATTRNALSKEDCKLETVRTNIRSGRKSGNLHRVDCFKDLMNDFNLDPSMAERFLSKTDLDMLMGR